MGELWDGEAQLPVEKNLLCRAQQQIPPSHHFGYTHQGVIHHDGQLVCPSPVTAAQDEISAFFCRIDVLSSVMPVGKSDKGVRHTYSGCCGTPIEEAATFLIVTAKAGIDDSPVALMWRSGRQYFAACAPARVCESFFLEDFQILCVQFAAFALKIGFGAAFAGTAVPFQPQHQQIVLDKVGPLTPAAGGIYVLDAEYPFPGTALC